MSNTQKWTIIDNNDEIQSQINKISKSIEYLNNKIKNIDSRLSIIESKMSYSNIISSFIMKSNETSGYSSDELD